MKSLQLSLTIINLFLFNLTFGQHQEKHPKFNADLSSELKRMVELDQVAAMNAFPPDRFKYLTNPEWELKKDSIYNAHQLLIEEIFNKHGYPGYNLVGKEGEHNYWLLVQHSDSHLEFQKMILVKLAEQVKANNANSRNFALLTDRVRINSGKKQLYGTQVIYIKESGQAIPRNLEDSTRVNLRRKSVELEPIEEYLNLMTEMYFEMNKSNLLKRGIKFPKLYPLKN